MQLLLGDPCLDGTPFRKGTMKSLVSLLEHLLQDCGRRSGVPTKRDALTLALRVKNEGDSFITITLPNFCSDFERCLAEGRVVPGLFRSFRKEKSGIPSFLKGFLHRVFDEVGELRSDADVDCILLVRQLCLFGKKVERPCSSERVADATQAFIQCDDEVPVHHTGQMWRYFGRVADILCDAFDLEGDKLLSMMPRHGPGATREGILGNQKWVFKRWHKRLESAGITFSRFGRASQCEPTAEEEYVMPDFIDPEDEEPVRVVFVPKTQKSPRVIAIEPVCMQYAQQGLWRLLRDAIAKAPMTRGHVNFRDQEVNQKHALSSSLSCQSATIDMKEASDRVSVSLASRMFASKPGFQAWMMACRSTSAQLPNGDVIRLKKFASMGSALCFPVESLVFFTSIIASRLRIAGQFPTARNVRTLARDVYVFGDDLIVPADEAPAICDDLELLGFKVNRRKSFWTGQFRESCGVDAYAGVEVTPVYLRRDIPADRGDANGILSSVATANQLFAAGFAGCATAIRKAVEGVVGRLPQVPVDGPAIGWNCFSEAVPRRRWDRNLQKFQELQLVPVQSVRDDPLEGDHALAKCFRLLHDNSVMTEAVWYDDIVAHAPEHLSVSPRRYGLALKRRWVPVH